MSITEKEFIDRVFQFQQNNSDFLNWESVRKHHHSASNYFLRKKLRKNCWIIACSFVAIAAYLLYSVDIFNLVRSIDCLVPASETLQDLCRPVQEDCSYCKILKIHVRSNLSDEEFVDKYAYSGLPLLVTDGMRDWNSEKINFQYFKDLYPKSKDDDFGDCQFFPYRTNFTHLLDVFNMSPERAAFKDGTEPWYIGWSLCMGRVSRELRKHYKVPYFLGKSERPNDDWVFMGSPGYKGAPLHIDYVDYASWQAQIRGRKKWTFAPPPECYFECPTSQSIVVEPGNVFVFDSNRWFHSTEVLEGEYSLTIGAEYD